MKTYRDAFPEDLRKKLPRAFDVVGDICIIKLPEELSPLRRDIGSAVLKAYKHIKVVCVDKGVKGEQRVRDVEVIAGEKRTETEHRENGCIYKLDIAQVYFSPRLSSERARIASLVDKREIVWDMFCGAGPFTIPIAKRAEKVCASDINEKAIECLRENIKRNRVGNISAFCGNARDAFEGYKFDRIVMNLPHSSTDFLDCALEKCSKGTIHLYKICNDPATVSKIIAEKANAAGRDIEGMNVKELHGYSVTEKLFCFDVMLR